MNELSIEEKAKRYDEALKQIKECTPDENGFVTIYPQEIFPELKEESEDEKIRKGLIKACKQSLIVGGFHKDKVIAWLEKQGNLMKALQISNAGIGELIEENYYLKEKQCEQKHADKVGDWLVHNERKNIVKVVNHTPFVYKVVDILGYHNIITNDAIENNYHLWTIQDAKDGDVLFMDNGLANCIFIYKSSNNGIINKYASYNKFGFEGEHYLVMNDGYVIPATKEQRDLLFQKMKEAGYEWDAEKKELKKIEQKLVECNNSILKDKLLELFQRFRWYCKDEIPTNGDVIEYVDTHIQELIDTIQNKPWSEEDLVRIENCISLIGKTGVGEVKWLQSLKDRIIPQPQPKQEWSEEDESMLKTIFDSLNTYTENGHPCLKSVVKDEIDWLKSLKDRVGNFDDGYKVGFSAAKHNQWKPSDEQMEALESATENCAYNEYQDCLRELIGQLKKLREN